MDYIVRPGDTFLSIAQAFGIAPEQLRIANPEILDVNYITVGQTIEIPETYQMRRIIQTNGYAFTNIDSQVLVNTLPYLTYLSIFSYQVLHDGALTGIDDAPLIQTARQARVAPIMVITNIEEGGGYSSDLAHTVLSDEQVQQTLINNVISILKSKNYYGLNIDFQYIYPADCLACSRFLQQVAERLHPLGYIVAVTVAPKTSADQRGLQYEAYNFPIIGRAADSVIIMTYEWGFTFGPPLAVAPIELVRQALGYATSAIPSQNILMGMPNYGYDWTLPSQTYTAAVPISFAQAEDLAMRMGAEIRFDASAQSSYFNYVDDTGERHVVWFDNEASVRVRLEFIETYNLGGVSFWAINDFAVASYQTLASMYDVRKVLDA